MRINFVLQLRNFFLFESELILHRFNGLFLLRTLSIIILPYLFSFTFKLNKSNKYLFQYLSQRVSLRCGKSYMTFVQMIIASLSIYIYLSAFQNCSCYCRSGGAIEPQPRGLAVTARCTFFIYILFTVLLFTACVFAHLPLQWERGERYSIKASTV